jgi:hypothetical protein
MNTNDHNMYGERLNQAERITLELEEADKDALKIAAVLSAVLDHEISRPHFTSVEELPWDEESTSRNSARKQEARSLRVMSLAAMHRLTKNINIDKASIKILLTEHPGGIRGPVTLKKFIHAILATDICAPTMPKQNKSEICQPLAFYLGCLSALASRTDMQESVMRVCLAGRVEALKLSAAAVCYPDGKILEDMAAGMAVVAAFNPTPKSKFANHLAAVLKAYKNLVKEAGSEPLKGHVIDAAIEILKKGEIKHHDRKDSARWTEILGKAGLKHLKQVRGTRGKSKNH